MAAIVEEADNKVVELFKSLNLNHTCYAHDFLLTVDMSMEHMGNVVPDSIVTKNLFVKDKKYGMYLVTLPHDRECNMKTLAALLKTPGANFRMADEKVLQEKLQIIRGAVSPLAFVNDEACEVKFAIDDTLLKCTKMHCHPLRSDRTLIVQPADLLAFLKHVKHEPIVLDFSTAPAPAASGAASSSSSAAGRPAGKQAAKPVAAAGSSSAADEVDEHGRKKETQLGLSVTKEENFASWYTQTITLSEMIDYSDISGCYILRPWSFHIWECIQRFLDDEIKKLGVQNSYFPIFVSERALNTEKDHVEGFAPEVAWVTKSGTTDLAEPIAVRPTSETIMYPFFAKWIRSHRDLPLQLNQWCNVVRWEFKDATPFIRSREFLWQEGHTAHATNEEAQARVMSILELYARVYEELLAVPVVRGMKTELEKFAGGHQTTTVEAYVHGSGRAIQGATSHHLGQNFGKMFKILYEDEQGGRSIPWQTSWGMTTRTIGVCVMVHGDDKGLVLPPRVAPIQVIICPIVLKNTDQKEMSDYCWKVHAALKAAGIRVDVDERKNYTPGWKFNHWEQKGVPVRIEIGPRDVANKQLRIVRRNDGQKEDISVVDEAAMVATVSATLESIQSTLLAKATAARDKKVVTVMQWKDFVPAVELKNMVLTPFCDEKEWEEKVKMMSREEALQGAAEEATCSTSVAAKTLCKPFNQPPLPEGTPCFVSGKPAKCWVLWGRSY